MPNAMAETATEAKLRYDSEMVRFNEAWRELINQQENINRSYSLYIESTERHPIEEETDNA